ncbi:MAG TPA: FAD-dependent oxidoreductase [Thermoleophilaceae bacterium]|nr:FAD-dependent oxidoreductase [Thermoleophilaceae bacterium]
MTEQREVDVAIVGAGLAGLVAARDLIAAGASAVVLEARDRVGGRLLNEQLGDGVVVEVGGQWVGPTQDRIAALAREMGVETFATHDVGDNVIEWRGALRRYRGTIPRIGVPVLLDVLRAQRKLNRMASEVPLDRPWLAPKAARWDGQTAQSWLRRNVLTRGGRDLLQLGTEAVWAAQPEDVSLLHMLFYIHSAGSLERLLDTAGGAQQDRFVGGSQRVPIALAERLGDGVVALGAAVRRIEHGRHGVTLHADRVGDARGSGEDRLAVRARRAVVAIAPTLAGRIVYDPPLPGHRDQLTQRMPLGTVAKCMAVYDEPFWRADGLSGQGLSDTGPIKLTYDNSPPDGRPGVLLGFLEGRQARELGRMTVADRRAAVIDCFSRLFGQRAARPERYVERLWAEEEYSRGCYGAHMPTGALDRVRRGAAGADRAAALGRCRGGGGLVGLHGRGRAFRTDGGHRGPGGALRTPTAPAGDKRRDSG